MPFKILPGLLAHGAVVALRGVAARSGSPFFLVAQGAFGKCGFLLFTLRNNTPSRGLKKAQRKLHAVLGQMALFHMQPFSQAVKQSAGMVIPGIRQILVFNRSVGIAVNTGTQQLWTYGGEDCKVPEHPCSPEMVLAIHAIHVSSHSHSDIVGPLHYAFAKHSFDPLQHRPGRHPGQHPDQVRPSRPVWGGGSAVGGGIRATSPDSLAEHLLLSPSFPN